MACLVIALMDYRRWKTRVVWLPYAVAIVALIAVFVPHIGVRQLGSHRWIAIGGITVQASEFAKLALILALAAYADRHQRKMNTVRHGIFLSGLIIGPVLGLIVCEVDVGTTITLGAVAGVMLLVAGVRWLHVLPIALVAVSCLVGYVAQDPVRMERVYALLDPAAHKDGKARQANNSATALAIGGSTGATMQSN